MNEEILHAIADHSNKQRDVARLYARLLPLRGVAVPVVDFPAVNRAIMGRWPRGLPRIKEMAWRIALDK